MKQYSNTHPGLTPEQDQLMRSWEGSAQTLWRDAFARIHALETGRMPAQPAPAETPAADELARLRAKVEWLTQEHDRCVVLLKECRVERDEARADLTKQCQDAREQGRQEAREGIAQLMEMQAEHYRRNAADPAMLRKDYNEWAHDFCRALARNARNWKPEVKS
jgi:citrate synthase